MPGWDISILFKNWTVSSWFVMIVVRRINWRSRVVRSRVMRRGVVRGGVMRGRIVGRMRDMVVVIRSNRIVVVVRIMMMIVLVFVQQICFLLMKQVPKFINYMLIRSNVEVDKWFDNLLSVIVFGNLYG